jgi:translation initiation factor SUI1
MDFSNKKITISVKAINNRQKQTCVYGFGDEYDLPKILKHFRKIFSCTGSIESSEEFGDVMKLTGDQKQGIMDFLTGEGIAERSNIIVKGI